MIGPSPSLRFLALALLPSVCSEALRKFSGDRSTLPSLSLSTAKTPFILAEMTRVGGGRRDKASDSILPESRLRNEEAADKIRKLLVPEGQAGAVVVTPASLTPATTVPGRIVLFTSFVAAGLVPPFSTFFLQVLETYGIQLAHLSPTPWWCWRSSRISAKCSWG